MGPRPGQDRRGRQKISCPDWGSKSTFYTMVIYLVSFQASAPCPSSNSNMRMKNVKLYQNGRMKY